MNNVWWAIVKFFQKLFVPPEYTTLERELVRQVSHLEGELFKERQKYQELTERLLFPPAGPVPDSQSELVPFAAVPPVRDRAKELSDLSHARWLERADLMAAEAEAKLRERDRGKEKATD